MKEGTEKDWGLNFLLAINLILVIFPKCLFLTSTKIIVKDLNIKQNILTSHILRFPSLEQRHPSIIETWEWDLLSIQNILVTA